MSQSNTKQVAKGKRPRHTSNSAPMRGENEAVRKSCGDSNLLAVEAIPDAVSIDKGKKKVRGPSKLNVIATGLKDRKEIEFNELGQPIGDGSIQLSSTLGILAREYVPITYKSWDEVTDDIKDQVWQFIIQKCNLDECRKDIILRHTGKLWKDFKSRLSKKILEEAQGPNMTRHLALLKPVGVKSKEWDEFIKDRLTPEFKGTSDKHKEARAKQIHPHTTSRRGYARLTEKMKKEDPKKVIRRVHVWIRGHKTKNNQPINDVVGEAIRKIEEIPSHDSASVRDDALTQVLGPERPGRVRGLGFGVTPTKVDAALQSSARVTTLEKQIQQLLEWKTHIESQWTQGNRPNMGQYGVGDDIVHDLAHTPQSHQESTCAPSAQNMSNATCKLLHWLGTGEVVANAQIESTDPKSLVHHQMLGPDCCKVWILEIIVPKVPVFRYSDMFSTLDDAKGSTIAWPHKYIRFE